MNEELTVGIPVYNRYDYFEEAIESALSQTLPCRVVVVDNASDHDRFARYCEARRRKGAPIAYHRNERNLGLFGNWNRCAELSETEFVVILCDDDMLAVDYSEEFARARRAHPGIDYFYGTLDRFGQGYDGHPPQAILFGLFQGLTAIKAAARGGLTWPTNATAYRTSHLRAHPFRFCTPKRASNADWQQVYTASTRSLCFGVDKPLYRYRQHAAQGGQVFAHYATLSRSLVFAEMAEILFAAGDPSWRAALFESVSIPVHVAISTGRTLSRLLDEAREDGDPYVRFVTEFWGGHSPIVGEIYRSPHDFRGRAAFILARGARFSSRVTNVLWKRLLLPEPERAMMESVAYLQSFRGEPAAAGIVFAEEPLVPR